MTPAWIAVRSWWRLLASRHLPLPFSLTPCPPMGSGAHWPRTPQCPCLAYPYLPALPSVPLAGCANGSQTPRSAPVALFHCGGGRGGGLTHFVSEAMPLAFSQRAGGGGGSVGPDLGVALRLPWGPPFGIGWSAIDPHFRGTTKAKQRPNLDLCPAVPHNTSRALVSVFLDAGEQKKHQNCQQLVIHREPGR